jgi:hypothetical protein
MHTSLQVEEKKNPPFAKRVFRNFMETLARWSPMFSAINRSLGWFIDYLRICRRDWEFSNFLKSNPRQFFVLNKIPTLTVQSGPFKGMKYPKAESFGSALAPKLTGSYECELHDYFELIYSNDYSSIVDIGCAEGYYAVGFAMRFPQAYVYAFDTNTDATMQCQEMARLNGVSNRFTVGDFCDSRFLAQLAEHRKCLIICDIEGGEKDLFSDDLISHLRFHDLLIETHDLFLPGISETLQQRFSKTHLIKIIKSLSDTEKVDKFHSPLFEGISHQEKIELIAEGRPETMEWLFLQSRNR